MESMKRTAAKVTEAVTTSSDEASAEIGQPSEADATWAAMMIPHHENGIKMAQLAIERAATDALRNAASQSKANQERDMSVLEKILEAAGKKPMPPEKPLEQMDEMHMQLLGGLSGEDFDRHWITVTGGHHMAAIMMSETALAGSASDGARSLQQTIRQTQLGEVATLNEIHQQLHR